MLFETLFENSKSNGFQWSSDPLALSWGNDRLSFQTLRAPDSIRRSHRMSFRTMNGRCLARHCALDTWRASAIREKNFNADSTVSMPGALLDP